MIIYSLLALFIIVSIIFVIWYKGLKRKAMKKVAKMNTAPSNKWTLEFLENKRKYTDSVADHVVDIIMQKNEKNYVNHLFGMIVNDDDQLPEDSPKELKQYFKETSQLPEWADPDLIAMGQQIYIRHGVWISLLLSYKSLPECYACAKGAEVLFHTARLNEHHGSMDAYSRRIAETAQFVLYAMSPGGLSSGGRGIKAAQKVRLIHGVIRYYLRQQNWDTAKFDEPINQEDMAGTLMSFSALILEGLTTINVNLEEVEKEAYMHCWRVVGHIMGLHDDLIPENAADALKLGHAILDHQQRESEHGKLLMDALLLFQKEISSPFMGEQTNIKMMRLMMGDHISDLLGVPASDKSGIEKLGKRISRITRIAEFLDHSLVLAMMVQFISKILLQFMIKHMTKSKIINFYIPKSLTLDWGVSKK